MDIKEKELWIKLYDIAKKIQVLQPWKVLIDSNILTYLSDEFKDVFYCSVMGYYGMYKAVAVYKGDQICGFNDFASNDYPDRMLLNYQECMICNFVERKKVLSGNKKIIKELGLKFRGVWISFENYEKGYEPSPLNIEQVKIMTKALENFYMMFKSYIENKIEVKFEKGETLTRNYDKKNKVYIDYISRLYIPPKEYNIIGIDGGFEENMKNLPVNNMELELEFLSYIPLIIRANKEKDGRYYYPRMRFLVDRKSHYVIIKDFIDKKTYNSEYEYVVETFEKLISFIQKYGKPKVIYVRDKETKFYLKEFEEKSKIKIKISPKLREIDKLYDMLENMN